MSKELLVIEEIPKVPVRWNYWESVKEVKVFMFKWKGLTENLALELYIARTVLSKPGARTDLKPEQTWSQYCLDIGSQKRIVNRWIDRLFLQPQDKSPEVPELPAGKFDVIYADPPWQYSNSGFEESAQSKYRTMPNEELFDFIEKLNPHIIQPAVLFLWVTAPFINIGFQVCEAWSFDYKTNMVWLKNKGPSIGWFVQGRHEHLFIATRGEGMHPKIRPISWFSALTTKHSKKPEEAYELIERMYPVDYKRPHHLELFARNAREGWVGWGLEYENKKD
jgi:N6-adenosine-specific RNA methylase IME4